MYKRVVKRLFDIIFSLIGIILIFPFMVIITVILKFKLGKPIFFKQNRTTKDGRVFKIYKFRTMLNTYDDKGELLPNDQRLTRIGTFLRSTSLDELPEIINILKGDISIIGPRPLVEKYLPLYDEEQLIRFKVKGGLIPPEVLYENYTPTWEEQFDYEINYAKNVSFMMDIKIVYAVFKALFIRNSINYGEYDREDFDKYCINKINSKSEEDI